MDSCAQFRSLKNDYVVSRAVHKLLKMDLVTHTSLDDDARIQALVLTTKGKRFYA